MKLKNNAEGAGVSEVTLRNRSKSLKSQLGASMPLTIKTDVPSVF